MMAEILFRRGSGWRDRFRAYYIFIDGELVGNIKASSDFRVNVTPGRHQIELRIDWCSSPPLDLSVEDGSNTVVTCGPNSKWLFELIYISFLRHRYIWIKQQSQT